MKITATNKQERIVTLDILRGFALLGILAANMSAFKSPYYQLQSMPAELASIPQGLLNQWSVFAMDFLVVGKFYPLFSFLFGLGFYLFYERIKEKGVRPQDWYKRRIVFLLGAGLLHLVFLWSGDILHTYALAGLLLLLFVHRREKTILTWACLLLAGSSIVMMFLVTAGNFYMTVEQGSQALEQARQNVAEAESVYSSGSYMEILSFRLQEEVPIVLSNLFFTIPNILGVFLIGLYVGKKGWLQHASFFTGKWKKIRSRMLAGGGILSLLFACLTNGLLPFPAWLSDGLASGLNIIAGPLFMLFYAAAAVLLCQRKNLFRLLKVFAPVGQMALTNYMLQTILCIFIFYGFGLQLFGTIDASTGILITAVIYGAQVVLSIFWMSNYSQGPLEKLWRNWTYRKQAPAKR
ncbi:DUF418 domain-containing protein [Salibacterium aidingense]|uniref:DUF418 domain-containing protein n=1 Tax=Salibacterium aidingense TaxID=384933 RepID=UPI003BE5186E